MIPWGGWLLRRVHAEPYGYYALLRRFRPLTRVGALRCWVLARTPDVVGVLRDPERYSSSVMAPADPYLLGADPPAHTRVRRALQRALWTASVPALEHAAQGAAEAFAARVRDSHEVDLIEELAAPLPTLVMATLLGIDPRQHRQFAHWSHAVVAESSRLPGATLPDRTRERVAEFGEFVQGLVAERQRAPGKDAISALMTGPPEDRLSAREAISLVRLLVIAGNETTTHLIGNALLAMLRSGRSATWGDGKSGAEALVEEALRYDPPVQFLVRATTAGVDLAGSRLPAGALVMTLLGATGRDPNQHPHPDRFDPARPPSSHLAFGLGPHACPGAALARMEARIALTAAIQALPQMHLARRARPVVRAPAFQLRGLSHLWIQAAGPRAPADRPSAVGAGDPEVGAGGRI